uniref:Uncharacterized protein n=1 Tax=Rhizophora mucronata TaxID=61149 RepID=A0A2P2NLC9_RHIMU
MHTTFIYLFHSFSFATYWKMKIFAHCCLVHFLLPWSLELQSGSLDCTTKDPNRIKKHFYGRIK